MKNTKRVARTGLLIVLALALSYLESLIPLNVGVPGIKLGLANLVVIFALYRLEARDAILISLIRVLLAAVLFGSVLSLAYSAAGAFLSFFVMLGLKASKKFSCTGVSIAGAVAHNLGQVLAAVVLLETGRLVWYFPALCVSSVVAGVCIGLVSALLIRRIK